MVFVMVTAYMWLVIDMRGGGHLEGGARDIILHAVAVIASFVGDFPLHECAIVDVFYNSSDNFL
jgi:hypothetical protein